MGIGSFAHSLIGSLKNYFPAALRRVLRRGENRKEFVRLGDQSIQLSTLADFGLYEKFQPKYRFIGLFNDHAHL